MSEVFSLPWAEAWARQINDSEAHRQAARTWEGGIVFCTGDPGAPGARAVFLDLWHGDCRTARTAGQPEWEQARFVIQAPLATWREVLGGRLAPITALMTGRLKLTKGNVAALLPFVAAARELVNAAAHVEGTTFPGDGA